MALIVQKYGGTSVADPDRMRNVAKHIAALRAQGTDVVAVVSAMGKATDNLVEGAGYCKEKREATVQVNK